jgi:hypothetical protein
MNLELITMGVSTISGFVLKYMANSQENTYKLLKKDEESRNAASKRSTGVWVRRFIVLVMMSIFSFIIIAPAFIDDLNTVIVNQGWFFTSTTEIKGIIYDDTTRQILLAIIGYYFGTSSASK